MGNQLPYNQWEVKYTLPSPVITLTPAITRSYCNYRHSAPVTFPLFPLLPPELRARIWNFAAPYERVIEIRSWGAGRYAPVRYSVHPHYLPAIFHVCKESRMEARRIYRRVGIGVSATERVKGQSYVDWEYHPANPNCKRRRSIGNSPLPYATPYDPTYVYLSWERDIIYLGPEFQSHHLLKFLTAQGQGRELDGLRYLALDRKLWPGDSGWGDVLRRALWSLRRRENLSEIIVVPDDEERCLADRWYYGKHEITLRRPEMRDDHPISKTWVQSFVRELDEWFERQWQGGKSYENKETIRTGSSESDGENEMVMQTKVPKPPKVSIMSVTRNDQKMREYADGLSDIQKAMGDMRVWKTWTPPASS